MNLWSSYTAILDPSPSNEFLDPTQKACSMKEITDKLYFIRLKNFRSVKDAVRKIRRQATDWEIIFVKDIYDKGILFKTYRELLKLNNKGEMSS